MKKSILINFSGCINDDECVLLSKHNYIVYDDNECEDHFVFYMVKRLISGTEMYSYLEADDLLRSIEECTRFNVACFEDGELSPSNYSRITHLTPNGDETSLLCMGETVIPTTLVINV